MKKAFSGLGGVLALCLATSAFAQGIKWHPGHYVMLPGNDSVSTHLAQIDEIGGVKAIRGVEIRIWWSDLEPSKGAYDFSQIDQYLNRLKRYPEKRLVVRIMDRRFNTTSKANTVPAYLLTSTYDYGLVRTHTGYAAKLWEKPIMDRLISLYKAIGQRYDADGRFEGVATEESTLSLPTPYPSGYTDWALEEQYKRFAVSVPPAMPHSNVFFDANWLGNPTIMGDLIQSFMPVPVAAGHSNVKPDKLSLGQQVMTGYYGSDYRGHLAMASSVESAELALWTPQQLNDFAYSTLKLNYIFWEHNTWAGGSASRWSTGVLPFLKTNPPYRSSCPTSYGTCHW